MDDKELLPSKTICEIFTKMSYGENEESFNQALEWLKSRDIFVFGGQSKEPHSGIPKEVKNVINNELLYTIYVPEIDTLKNIVCKYNYSVRWADTPAFQRTSLLYKLALEIENNSNIFAQLEMIIRGILAKDTKMKSVPLLAQYFYFYSGFSVKYNVENSKFMPSGLSVGVISDENSLSNIGLYLAPALAAGYNIILQAGTKIFSSIQLIVDLAQKVGIPQGVIQLIPSDDGELLPYLYSANVAIVTLMVDLNNNRYKGINNYNKKIISLTSYKTPIIVFDNADLDSACENVIEAVWGHKGFNLWSADIIIVQENIFTAFLNKLTTKLKSLRMGSSHDKTVDISNAFDNFEIIRLAQNQGLEVFETNNTTDSPTLIIGGRIQGKKSDNSVDNNIATILQFRTIDEAVDLANNSIQGIGATVWSENIGIINEVTRKLNVSNIWINNNCGINSADITISPIKESGFGYFGGKEGFYEYTDIVKITSSIPVQNIDCLNLNKNLDAAINNAKKSQQNWKNLPKINKIKIFHQFADYLDENKKKNTSSLPEQWVDKFVNTLYQCVTNMAKQGYTSTSFGYNFVTIKEPRGIVTIDLNKDITTHNVGLILTAIFEGNAVILLDESAAFNFYQEFSKKLPHGILNVFQYNLENVKTISTHKDINVYFGRTEGNPIFPFLPVQDTRIFTYDTASTENIIEKVTFSKNIWSDIGKSSSCKLGVY